MPPELDAVVLAALERDPTRRTPSAEELERALSALLLRMARTPQDWDLRFFMHQLWPEGLTQSPAVRLEETQVRPAPGELVPLESSAPGPGVPPPAPLEDTAATRTIAPGTRGGGWRLGAVAAALVVASAAGGVAALRSWRTGGAPDPGIEEGRAPSPPAPAGAPAPSTQPPAQAGPGPAAGTDPGSVEEQPPPASAGPNPDRGGGSPEAGSPEASRDDGTRRPGVLYVNATPWARIVVDGRAVGETPLTLSLPTGRHRLRAVHPSYGASETVVEIRAGRRVSWTPSLQRE